jgi:hypothetical protein
MRIKPRSINCRSTSLQPTPRMASMSARPIGWRYARQQLVAAGHFLNLEGAAVLVVQFLQPGHQAARLGGVGQPGGHGQSPCRQRFVGSDQGGLDLRQTSVAGQFPFARCGFVHFRQQPIQGRQRVVLRQPVTHRPCCFGEPHAVMCPASLPRFHLVTWSPCHLLAAPLE